MGSACPVEGSPWFKCCAHCPRCAIEESFAHPQEATWEAPVIVKLYKPDPPPIRLLRWLFGQKQPYVES